MIQERKKRTYLQRLYPSTKLWMGLALTLSVILLANTWFSLAVLISGVLLIVHEKYYTEFKVVAVTLVLMFISMFLINGALYPGNDYNQAPTVLIPLIHVGLYREGLLHALSIYQRIAPLMCTLFLFFRTINMTDLGVAMNQAGLPYRTAFIFTTTFQILPVLSKEMHQITDAQKSRGLETDGNLIKRMKAFVPIMIPVVSNSIMKVQNQAVALETKGFNTAIPKTVYRELKKEKSDYVLMYVSWAVTAAVIIYKIARLVFYKSF